MLLDWRFRKTKYYYYYLLINLSDPFLTQPSDRAQIWHACADRDDTGSHQKKLTNPTPEGFRGLFIYVCGMWDVCGMFVA